MFPGTSILPYCRRCSPTILVCLILSLYAALSFSLLLDWPPPWPDESHFAEPAHVVVARMFEPCADSVSLFDQVRDCMGIGTDESLGPVVASEGLLQRYHPSLWVVGRGQDHPDGEPRSVRLHGSLDQETHEHLSQASR
jgi:hypothetical protein